MRFWTPGELLELEHAALAHETRVEKTIVNISSENFKGSWIEEQEKIRRLELTAAALREFCQIQRGEKRSHAA